MKLSVKEFNEKYPTGTKVIVSPYLGCPESEKVIDETVGSAFEMCGEVMVRLKEKRNYCIENIEVCNASPN